MKVDFPHKTTNKAIYAHASSLRDDALDRAEEAAGLAGVLLASVQIVKFGHNDSTVSLLSYPGFNTDACPALERSWTVHFDTGEVRERSYSPRNPPILHRKELLLSLGYPNFAEFENLTLALEDIGMFDDTTKIGFLLGWQRLLKEKGYKITGHTLTKIEE